MALEIALCGFPMLLKVIQHGEAPTETMRELLMTVLREEAGTELLTDILSESYYSDLTSMVSHSHKGRVI